MEVVQDIRYATFTRQKLNGGSSQLKMLLMRKNYDIEGKEFMKLVGSGNTNAAACIATGGVSLIVGYGLGWRGGRWYANRKFKREQMKLLGQVKPKRWQLKFLKRPIIRLKRSNGAVKAPETVERSAPMAHNPSEANPA
ncbi:hypothetical protein HanOQP8_Chr04g0167751 [Helianthus annuus]|nr:hypothetical protein HanHA89_Chr04g0169431 [Helianthus annuus]KAJ0763033.1 hypothetical protein HanOQP8_Chr04g0167751 [Helianthus annuus]